MSESIVDRIKAALDEDERVALAVGGERSRGGDYEWDLTDPQRHPGLIGNKCGDVVTYGHTEGGPLAEEAAHIARHDPARVLRQVAAMRKILDEHDKLFASASERRKAGQPDMALNGAVLALHGVVKRLAEALGIEDGP